MIPTIGDYLYQLHHHKQYWLTRAERRRAILLLCGITACLGLTLFLWLK